MSSAENIPRIYTVAQQKGGAGKSTLAAHLAVAWALQGKAVALVDIDPQGSLGAWAALRMEQKNAGAVPLTFEHITGWRTQNIVETLAASHDVVIVDSPPHADTEARIAIRAADVVVVPVQPSPLDLWAVSPTLEAAGRERSPALLVLNRMPPRGQLAGSVSEKLGMLDSPVAHSTIGNRIAFAEAMAVGRTALETKPTGIAAEEIRSLAIELAGYNS